MHGFRADLVKSTLGLASKGKAETSGDGTQRPCRTSAQHSIGRELQAFDRLASISKPWPRRRPWSACGSRRPRSSWCRLRAPAAGCPPRAGARHADPRRTATLSQRWASTSSAICASPPSRPLRRGCTHGRSRGQPRDQAISLSLPPVVPVAKRSCICGCRSKWRCAKSTMADLRDRYIFANS